MNAATDDARMLNVRQVIRHLARLGSAHQPRLLTGPPSPDPRVPVTAIDPNSFFPG